MISSHPTFRWHGTCIGGVDQEKGKDGGVWSSPRITALMHFKTGHIIEQVPKYQKARR